MELSKLKDFEDKLRSCVKGDVLFDKVTLGIYSTDASIYQITPIAVVLPRNQADVIIAVRIAAEFNVSILPRGGGTSLNGQCVASAMVIDFSKYMNQILEVNTGQRWVRVQPGLVLDILNADLAPHRLHFAPDPATSSRATLGGMMANNSAGTRSIIYGITQNHILEMKLLLCDGTILDLKELSQRN